MFLPPLAEQRTEVRYVGRGSTLLIVEPDGSAGGHPLTGLYYRQTRFLRDLRLRVQQESPHVCSIAEAAPNELELTFIHPEVGQGGGGGSGSGGLSEHNGLLHRCLDLRLRYAVHPGRLDVALVIVNRWQDTVELDLAWLLSADYASVDEAHFGFCEQLGDVEVRPAASGVDFRYLHPELPLETYVRATGAEWHFGDGALLARLRLPRQQPKCIEFCVRTVDALDAIDADGAARRDAALEYWQRNVAEVHSPTEPALIEYANRAAHDIGAFALLEGPEDEWLTPGAGVPLYSTLWARDALTTSWQAGLLDRGAMIEHVLSCLARTQGTATDPARDEEPGRILNQAKLDPLSRLGRSGFDRYYADVASPFMFIIALGYHYALTGDKGHVARRFDAAMRVLAWADEYGDGDGDGYIEYLTRAEHGPRHQGWKDSENAVVDEAGVQVEPPVAPCEIQGYWYVSLQFMAVLSFVMGKRKRALDLWRRAAALKERFNRDFWMDDEGFIAFGLDADKRPIRALTSNAGQCLPTGILSAEHLPRLVRRLFEPDLFSGWGIRTLSTGNPAYHPLDYHLGSVWPVENATILFGLRRYGYNDHALQLTRALYDLARLWPQGRTPECVGGYARDELAHPGAYPRANRPQAWNQSVWSIVVQSLLGLVPYAPLNLLLVDPILPTWLPELTIKRLRVGDATVTLRCYRVESGESRHEVVERQGTLRVVRQPWLESASAGGWERLAGLAGSI